MNDEKQDDEDDLFGKLVADELKSLAKRQKYRLKHEINNLKTKTMLINVSQVQIEFKVRLFMLKLMGPLKIRGIGIMICKNI